MNAASIQLKCTLDGQLTTLLCGDASPSYLHNLDTYQIIQLPHHGKLDNAEEIFDALKSPYSKQFLVSENKSTVFHFRNSVLFPLLSDRCTFYDLD